MKRIPMPAEDDLPQGATPAEQERYLEAKRDFEERNTATYVDVLTGDCFVADRSTIFEHDHRLQVK